MQQPLEFESVAHADYIFQVVGLDGPHLPVLGLALASAIGAVIWLRHRTHTRE